MKLNHVCNEIYIILFRLCAFVLHDDVIKWKHFPRNWPFVRGIHRSRWIPHTKASGALMFSLICVWINGWVNSREVGDLSRHRGHYDVIVMGNGFGVFIVLEYHQPGYRILCLLHNGSHSSLYVYIHVARIVTITWTKSGSPFTKIGIPIINLGRSDGRRRYIIGNSMPITRCLVSEDKSGKIMWITVRDYQPYSIAWLWNVVWMS